MRRYKNQYCITFLVDDIGFLYGRDILELINFKYSLAYCPICNQMFVKRDGRTNFCPKKQYEEWLKKKHKELTKRPKKARYANLYRVIIFYIFQFVLNHVILKELSNLQQKGGGLHGRNSHHISCLCYSRRS